MTYEELRHKAHEMGYTLVLVEKKLKPLVKIKTEIQFKRHLHSEQTTELYPNLKGCMRGILGDASGIRGDCSRIYGNVSAIRGSITNLEGDVSGLSGDVTGLRGKATGVWGECSELKGFIREFIK